MISVYKILRRLIVTYIKTCLDPELAKNASIRRLSKEEMARKGCCVFTSRNNIKLRDVPEFEAHADEEAEADVCFFAVSKDSTPNPASAAELKQKTCVILWDFDNQKVLAEGTVISSSSSSIEAMLKCSAQNLKAWLDQFAESLALVTQNSRTTRDRVLHLFKEALPRMIASSSSLLSHLVSFLDGNHQHSPQSVLQSSADSFDSKNLGESSLFGRLNDSQKQAVRGALNCSHFYMIHGPPGTGKSHTIVAILEALFKANKKVLVCAESHNPVDNLLAKFVETSEHVQSLTDGEKRKALIRIGNSWQVDSKSKDFLLETLTIIYKRKLKAMQGVPGKQPLDFTDIQLKLALISKAKTVFSTKCAMFNKFIRDHFLLEENKFDYAVVDEASQSFTAFTLMAIACAKKIIFAGDHLQLPPVITCRFTKWELEVSLFEKLVNRQKSHPPETPVYTMLDTQYRMNELLMKFSNDEFYAGSVKTGQQNRNRLLKDLVARYTTSSLPLDKPVLWIDNPMPELRKDEGNISNEGEAALVVKVIKELLRIGVQLKQIGVIVGYNAQRTLVSNTIEKDKSMPFIRTNTEQLMVATVDSFQGREREVIIFATTRSNASCDIGFLKDERRLNVAATRAKILLIVVGNQQTLNNDDSKFGPLFRAAQTHGTVIQKF